LELPIDPENEPKEPRFLQNTAWVQHHDHQKALLESFAAPLVEQSSLVLFYATRRGLDSRLIHEIAAHLFEGA
jgi:hypothetical protein